MVRDVLWSAAVCTSKGLLYACRFLWVSPYHALSEVPRRHCDAGSAHSSQTENAKESESQERPHCHGRSNVVHKRLCKVEGEIELLRAQICSEKASWELRFVELQRKQQELRDQLSSEPFLGEDGEDVGPAEPKAENAHSFVDKDLPSSTRDPPEAVHWPDGSSCPIPTSTCRSGTGCVSCCPPGVSARAPCATWAPWGADGRSTWAWSWRRMSLGSVTAPTGDSATFDASQAVAPLWHSISC